ncbi:MAG: ATP-binding protein [Bacilli bacterium]|nr:ATP-binding protein [Bacilli bacterium]
MGKVIILGGNARSGKSTLAYRLVKSGFNRISFDNIYSAMKNGLQIDMDDVSEEKQFAFFESIVDKCIDEAELENINSVIDMYDFMPKDIDGLKNKDKVSSYFLAYPNVSKETIKYNVVHYAKPSDWISQVDEDYLNLCVERFYERNIILVEQCAKYNQTLIDTKSGKDRDNILNNLFDEITKK